MVKDHNHLLQKLVPGPLYLRKLRILGVGGVESAMWSWSATNCCKNWFALFT